MDTIAEFEAAVKSFEGQVMEAFLKEDETSQTRAFFDGYEVLRKHMKDKSVAYAVRLTLKTKNHVLTSAVVRPSQILELHPK